MKIRPFSLSSLFFILFIAMFFFTVYMTSSNLTDLQTQTNEEEDSSRLNKLEISSDGTRESAQSAKETFHNNKLAGSPELELPSFVKDEQVANLEPEISNHSDLSQRISLPTLATEAPTGLDKEKAPVVLDEPPQEFYFGVHSGSFRKLSRAKIRVERLNDKGLNAWWQKVDIMGKGEWFRVYIGKQKTKAEALSFGKSLKAKGIIDDFYVHKLKL